MVCPPRLTVMPSMLLAGSESKQLEVPVGIYIP